MTHWLAPGPARENGEYIHDLNRAVDGFDLERFVQDFRATGADWLIFTIGQNTSYYASPNAVLDRLAGPGHCSKRDLVLEIAQRLHKIGKRFIAYLPSEVKPPRTCTSRCLESEGSIRVPTPVHAIYPRILRPLW